MSKKIQIIEKKLGRERFNKQHVIGLCYENGKIFIDPRQIPKDYLGSLIHECIHYSFKDMTEEEVLRGEKIILNVLWKQGYRKVIL